MQELNLKLTDWFPLLPFALLLYVAHIPGLGFMRVDALALFVALFSIYRHQGLPLGLAFGIGLLQDIVSLAPMGQHAIGLVTLAYFAQAFRDRIRIQGLLKQLPAIFAGLLLVKFIHNWVVALGFGQLPTFYSLSSVLVTAFFWPILVLLTFKLTRKRRIRQVGFN